MITVPGYYAVNKKASSTTLADESSDQPPHPGRGTMLEQPFERYTDPINSPSMCNIIFGVNNSAEIDTISSNLANLVIIVELKDPNDFETILKDIDEELCRVRELNSTTEAFKG